MTKAKISSSFGALLAASVIFSPNFAKSSDLLDGLRDPTPTQTEDLANWTGIQVNLMGGYAFGNSEVSFEEVHNNATVGSIALDGLGSDGWAGEVGLGYDHRIGGRWVVGAEVKYQLSNALTELNAADGSDSWHGELEQKNTVLAGVRLGHLAPSHMWYIGVGYARREYEDAFLAENGMTIGALDMPTFEGFYGEVGAEKHLGGNAFFRMSGRYIDFREETVFSNVTNGSGLRVGYNPDELQVMGGIVYKLGY